MKQDMTTGAPARTIIEFSIPIALGNIFQQLYNTADAVIAGRMIGEDALAAIGVANPIMSVAIFFIFGICIGVSLLTAQLYGAKDFDGFKVQTSTSLIAGTGFTLVLTIICIIFSRQFLIWTATPDAILNDADQYLKIIFAGLIFSFLYNFYSSALRAMGDSRTPFIFLLISSVLHVVLDIIFIGVFNMGVSGTAVATVISQAVSAVLCIIYVYIKNPLLAIKRKEFVFDVKVLVKTVNYSWVSAIQQIFLYVGRLLVQGTVNPLGTNVIAAYNSAVRVEAFVIAVFDSTATAVATFSAQNFGAGLKERIFEGFKKSININTVYFLVSAAVLFIFPNQVMGLFVSGSESSFIEMGGTYLKVMSLFYIFPSITTLMQGLFRGVGLLRLTMVATGLQFSLRVIFSYILVPRLGIEGICYATVIGWIGMVIFQSIYAKKSFQGT